MAEMMAVLHPHVADDWEIPAGSLNWSCWTTAAHVAHDLMAYAGQVAGQPTTAYLPFDADVRANSDPQQVLDVVVACGQLLEYAVTSVDPSSRAWHWGACDPAGFAAMGVAEVLLHTYDITRGLGIEWAPPEDESRAVLDRLFPDAPDGPAVDVLLWSTGRGELPDRPRLTSWRYQAALDAT